MGKPLPGFNISLIDPATGEHGDTGEICIQMDPRPIGLFVGYVASPEKNQEVFREGYYHTGDIAERDEDGYIYYIGRADDVFKASDYPCRHLSWNLWLLSMLLSPRLRSSRPQTQFASPFRKPMW